MASWSLTVLAVVAALSLGPIRVAGQTPVKAKTSGEAWKATRTPDGQPDLQGVWVSNTATPLERPKELGGRQFLTNAEVVELQKRANRIFKSVDSDFASGDAVFLAAWNNVQKFQNPNSTGGSGGMIERVFENRTSQIVDPPDGKIPPVTREALQRRAATEAVRRTPAGPEDFSNALRCITYGVPRLGGQWGAGSFSYYQILQSPGYVVISMELNHEVRIIPLDGRPHLPNTVRQWNGDSRGRWEGETLVVDTTNFSPKSDFMGSAENLHLVERFTRIGPETIDYEVTLDDPTTWIRPWTAIYPLKQTQEALYEFACHEGNYTTMIGILGAARAEEAAEEKAK